MTAFRLAALAVIAAAVLAPTAAPAASWLDAKPIVNWNHAGAPLPHAPKSQTDADTLKRCAAEVRHPASAEDRALHAAGWMLFAPLEIYNGITLVQGAADFDGMCRATNSQAFVFKNGRLAGTLSPKPTMARTDGSLQTVYFFASELSAPFNRYKESDPLCCPSATTTVSFTVKDTASGPLLVPGDAFTTKSSP
jgi:hypothetical protein